MVAPTFRDFRDRLTMHDMATPRLEMREITKNFGGVHALSGVGFKAVAGEVHAICGENGAGKSTLMKILAGAILADGGQILLDGEPVKFDGPRDAEDRGIRIIYQELNLVPELSVSANLFLGREKTGPFGFLDGRAMEAHARAVFERLGTPISPRARVADLRIGDQQMVEIAKALAFDASILIMDEPTSALSDAEVARLYRVIRDLKSAGTTILYISHKMNEVFTLADTVTVLRDGKFVASAPRAESEPSEVIRWMVGREIAGLHFDEHPQVGPRRLEVRGLGLASPPGSGRPALRDLDFHVGAGEVVGVAGLMGAGRTELLEALFGACPSKPRGTILLDGEPATFSDPGRAIEAGVALVTEDRKTLGLFANMTVAENITIRRLDALTRGGLVDPRAERQAVRESIERLSIKTDGGGAPIGSLSGGNQQKCIIARWLLINPQLLLLDEPTRGIDVGAKAEIYALIRRLASEGMAILMTSSELPELLTVADRILVLCEGRLTANLPRSEASEESIMHAATRFLDRVAG
ncbi:sugar ABC transporter ATP-binding protein [Tundrisphaera lichenicola]|uniref:sugar ABC transporter ATP-binding protein n=1 Tax=Tundrisphaera lichenicola TaxID=2029860 RepID=UPI003EBEFBAD